MHRRSLLLPLLALALFGSAHALDANGLAPALEAAFPPSVAYLDCPYATAARTCVLVPDAASVKTGARLVLGFLRSRPAVQEVQRKAGEGAYAFHAGDTSYHLRVTRSRARPGMIAATLSFTFDRGSATHAVCLHPNALFDLARLPSLTAGQYASMATAITCHGADPTDAQGRTPLWGAVASGNVAAVRTLLRGGADPNHISDNGWTPLLEAARSGTRAVLDALLQAGGDPTYVAPDGATLASLRPFNAHLTSAGEPAGDAVLPELPGSLPEGAALALARPAAAAVQAAPTGSARQPSSAVRKVAARPATVGAQAAGGRHEAASTAPRAAGTPEQAAPSRARTSDARSSVPRPFPSLPLAAVLLAVAVVLAIVRARRHAPEARSPALTDTGTEWQALARPKPLSRSRRARRLDATQPWNDPLG